MFLIRPKRIKRANRARVAKMIRAARRKCTHWRTFNPSYRVGVAVIWRGYGYIARCIYFDGFTGSRCTFDIVLDSEI